MSHPKIILSSRQFSHVILQSADEQDLFPEEEDAAAFLRAMEETASDHSLCFYAYCLMERHVHLLFYSPGDPGAAVYSLKKRYSAYYRRTYGRKGPLFQGRFKGQNIQDPAALVRFICQDPVRTGLVRDPFAYPRSSAAAFEKSMGPVDRKVLLSLAAPEIWRVLIREPVSGSYLEYDSRHFPGPRETGSIIRRVCSPEEKRSFHYLPLERKRQILRELRSSSVTYSAITDNLRISKYEIDLALGRIRDLKGNECGTSGPEKSKTTENVCKKE